MKECHMSQNLRHEIKPVDKHFGMTVEHELQCSHITFINHGVTVLYYTSWLYCNLNMNIHIFLPCRSEIQIQIQHERSPGHIQSLLDLSYGNHWNQGSNKQRVLLSQSIRNQSGQGISSYGVEVKPFHILHILLYSSTP